MAQKRLKVDFYDRLSETDQETYLFAAHLPPLATLHELLRILNIKACGQLSQNFLFQPWSIKGLVNCAGNLTGGNVLEVGPGPAGITRYILEQKPNHLAVVEIDSRFLLGLEQLKAAAATVNTKMDIYHQDILKFNYDNVFPNIKNYIHADQAWDIKDVGKNESENKRINIIGNLPFNISTILVSRFMHDISEHRGLWSYAKVPLTLTFQEEVAKRMIAEVYNPERSRLSILCQSLCQLKIKRIIPGTAFLPKAKVDCAVVHMIPRQKPYINVPYPYLDKLVKAIFQFKCKNICAAIESLFPPDCCKLAIKLFVRTGINPKKYPIELCNEEFKILVEEYYEICREYPNILLYDFRSNKNSISYRERKKMQRTVLDGQTINADFIESSVEKIYEDLNKMD